MVYFCHTDWILLPVFHRQAQNLIKDEHTDLFASNDAHGEKLKGES